jgi:extradiol dioxygenase family protein
MTNIFHLAIHVNNLNDTRQFYGNLLGCAEGRSTDTWVDFNFFGHQLSFHLGSPFETENSGLVASVNVPMPHFGAVLPMAQWHELSEKLKASGLQFEYGPAIRFEGQPGEQATMFFRDPSGNPIELKGFKDLSSVFDQ